MFFGLPAGKLTFVGFKGPFQPEWVHLEVDTERAKVHQVLPVPVVHKMKLWVAGRVGRTANRRCSPQILTQIHSPLQKCTDTHLHIYIHTASTTVFKPLVQDQVFSRLGSEKWCDSVRWKRGDSLPELALPTLWSWEAHRWRAWRWQLIFWQPYWRSSALWQQWLRRASGVCSDVSTDITQHLGNWYVAGHYYWTILQWTSMMSAMVPTWLVFIWTEGAYFKCNQMHV